MTPEYIAFAKWADEEMWEIVGTTNDLFSTSGLCASDLQKHIERTELPGCPDRQFIFALKMGVANAPAVPDGKREVRATVRTSKA